MPIITVSSDFGLRDPDAGRFKGLILQSIPEANIIDVSHQITPFNKSEAIYVLGNSLLHYPERTIHLVAVESATPKQQRSLLFEVNKQFFLGTDDGVLGTILQDLNPKVYQIQSKPNELFMQTAIRIARKLINNNLASDLGVKVNDYETIKLSKPGIKHIDHSEQVSTIITKVIYNDNYGNAIFNLTKDNFEKWRNKRAFSINFGPHIIKTIIDGYHDFETKKDRLTHAGEYFARFNDYGFLEIFVYQSNRESGGANSLLGLRKHQTVIINF